MELVKPDGVDSLISPRNWLMPSRSQPECCAGRRTGFDAWQPLRPLPGYAPVAITGIGVVVSPTGEVAH